MRWRCDVSTTTGGSVSHANARLTVHGRPAGPARRSRWPPVAHVAKEMGVSQQCVHRWVGPLRAEGEAGLQDRSSRPHRCPAAPPPGSKPRGRGPAEHERRGPDWIGAELGVPARTVSRGCCAATRCRICARLDPITGQVIRASKATAISYERDRPGELVAHGREEDREDPRRRRLAGPRTGQRQHQRARTNTRSGFDYVHSLVDDHSRLAYSEVLPDEKGSTCAGFLTRAAAYFAAHGITRIERVMTDNAWAYRYSLRGSSPSAGRPTEVHQAALPLAKRQSRKTEPDPADRVGLPAGLHQQRRTRRRPCPLDRVLQHSTTPQRTRRTPTGQPTATNLMAGYT